MGFGLLAWLVVRTRVIRVSRCRWVMGHENAVGVAPVGRFR